MLPMRAAAILLSLLPASIDVAADRPNMPVTPIENCPPSTGRRERIGRIQEQEIGLRVQLALKLTLTAGENLPI